MTSFAGPLAIVGIGCRFPGGATSPSAFWRLLCSGVDAIREIPADRFDLERVFDRDPSSPGRIYTRWGGFIDGIDRFDAGFFGMSPREARHVDPQQRLLLELTWEAMEDAGIRADSLAGTRTGVFVGISTHDYGDIQTYPQNRHLVGSHTNIGTATSLAANRISHAFDLRGPSLIVDTACSSSLTALHLACQSLRAGDCDAAVVGGVQMLVTPEPTIGFCKASMLSPDGRCRAFDARANGYVRSEGGGVVIVRPLAAALAAGDPIYAVVRGTAINQDGRTTGITVPSGRAQEEMLRAALASAGVAAGDIHYLEAHGTGTPVGDPIEAAAMGAVLSAGRGPTQLCAIGSVKTNIGHLEAASGMAGLIKTALAIRHRAIPPSLHFESPNPAIDFAALRLRVVTSLERWPEGPGPATAGVNGFGFGGANAHVVLQEHERPASTPAVTEAGDRPEVLVISARSAPALAALAREYMALLAGAEPLRAICGTAALRRTALAQRLSVVGTRAEIVDGLDAFLASERRAAVTAGRAPAGGAAPIAFVFSGMGPQWWAMGRQLLRDEPVFRTTVERCEAALPPEAGWSLLAELLADEAVSRVSDADLAQVTGFAVQAGIAEVLRSRGIVPAAVFGHSAGEMAAAFVSGALTLEACVPLAYHRSRLQASAPPGRMLAAAMSEPEARRLVAASGGRLSLAAINSPASVTLSGDASELEALHERLQREQVFARLLPFPVAYHSAAMDGIESELRDCLAYLAPVEATIPMVSAVTGGRVSGGDLGAEYWWNNVRQPVRFADGIGQLIADGCRTFVEIGPHPVLAVSMAECLAASGETGTILPTLRRNEDERAAMLRTTGALHAHGHAVDWTAVFGTGWAPVALPLYPWDRERHWFDPESDSAAAPSLADDAVGSHPLLGQRLQMANATWESTIGHERLGYLDDHIVQGAVVFPGVAYLEMAAAAVRQLQPDRAVVLRDVAFVSPLFGGPGRTPRVQLTMDRDGRFDVHSVSGDRAVWTLHAHGRTVSRADAASSPVDLAAIRDRCAVQVSHEACYEQLEARGLTYGSAFRGIRHLSTGDGEALGRIALPAPLSGADDHAAHPALFDAALQVLIGAAASAAPAEAGNLFLPVGIAEVSYHHALPPEAWSYAKVTARNRRHVTGDVLIVGEDGSVLVSVRGLRCQVVERTAGPAASMDECLYEDRWQATPLPTMSSAVSSAPLDFTRLHGEADTLSVSSGWDRYYRDVEPALDALASAYAASAFEELGWKLEPGERIASSLIDAMIPASRRPFADRLLGFLQASGVLQRGPDGFVVNRPPASRNPAGLSSACRTAWPDYAVHLDLLDRCGASLAANLRGTRPAQDVLFGDGGFRLLETFYREAPASAFYNTLAASAVSSIVRAIPDRRPYTILEVGAGTGGTTAAVLPALEHSPEAYVFSDISRSFLDAAQARFRSFPFFSTALYDLENATPAAGLPRGRFDVVIAANVVHATPDVSRTLSRLASLLEPGGVLVVLEITRQPMWLDVVFGLTDEWWQFRDRATRPDHPLLPRTAWEQLLADAGFAEVTSVADSVHPGEAAQRVLIARAPAQRPAAIDARHWVLLADATGVARKLSDRLIAAGATCTIVRRGERFARTGAFEFECDATRADDIAALFDTLAADGRPVRGVVHLQALDVEEADTSDALLASQRVSCGPALSIVRGLAGMSHPPELWLITAGAQTPSSAPRLALGQSALWGLGRVIMREHPALRCRLIDLDTLAPEEDVEALAREILEAGHEEEVAFRGGTRQARRLQRLQPDASQGAGTRAPLPDECWSAHIGTPGALQTLELRARVRSTPGPDQVEVEIAAAAVNFRDVMVAMGTIPGLEQETSFGSRQLGLDAAGTILACGSRATRFQPGDAVMGIVPGAFGSRGITSEALLTRKPASLDFEQAAGVPCVFVTAHYALNHLARLQAGERVLIHSATGGVGLAAIQFARDAGAEIFATAGSADKRDYLRALGIRHVMDSRTTAFEDEIMRATAGEGIDVVLNSLSGEALAAGLRVLRPFGRFLEIGKRDIYDDGQIGLLPFRKNLSLHAIDLDRLCVERPAFVGSLLREVADGFERGRLQPLPHRAWPISRMEDAMRFMAQARHIGKIVLSLDDPGVALAGGPGRVPLFRPDGTYLITGGLGGFGLAVAERLLRRGAGAVALVGRRPPSAEIGQRLDALRAGGGRVDVLQADVASSADAARILEVIRGSMPPLRGVVHAAMVLDDGPLEQMEWPQFERVLAPKIAGAWNLHTLTAGEPLDLFVMFSSIAALLGNPLQANYAAANAYLDAMAHHRRACGLPGTSIAWGVLSEVGYVAARLDLSDYLARQGYLAFSPEQALDVLEHALEHQHTTVMAARLDWTRWAVASPTAATSARFRQFAAEASAETTGARQAPGGTAAVDLSDPATRRGNLDAYLRGKVARVLGAPAAAIEPDRPLTELGLDSLIAVELMTALRIDIGLELPVVKLLQGVTTNGLAALALEQMSGPAPGEPADALPRPEPVTVPGAPAIMPGPVAPVAAPPDIVPREAAAAAVARPPDPGEPASAAARPDAPWSAGQRFIRRGLAMVLGATTDLSVDGLEWLPASGPAILAVNHLSSMDVPLAFAVLPRPATMFAKEELRRWRIIDWLLSDIGRAIYVRRGEGDRDALDQALAVLKAGGIVALGPEGHRSPGGLTQGQTGVGYLASRAGVPVVPMAAWGQERLGVSWQRLQRAPVHVRFGPPVSCPAAVATGRELHEYSDAVMRAIAAQLPDEYRGVYK